MDWTSAVPEPKTDRTGGPLCSFCKAPAITVTTQDCDGCLAFAQTSHALGAKAVADIEATEAAAKKLIDSVPEGQIPTEQDRAELVEILTPLAGLRAEAKRQNARAERHLEPHNHPVFACKKHFEKAGLPPAAECVLDEGQRP